jgi:hypothetical protein
LQYLADRDSCRILLTKYLHEGFKSEQGANSLNNILYGAISLADLLIRQQKETYLISKVFGVICSALIYIPDQTIKYTNSEGNFSTLMGQMVMSKQHFLTQYDRRLLSLALMSIFRLKVQQGQIDNDALRWFETAILTLHVQRVEEDLKGSKSAYHITKDKRKKLFKETRSEEDKQDIKLYNMIIGRGIDLDKLLEDDEPSSIKNEEDDMLHDILKYVDSAKLTANRSVHKLHSPINQVDEFSEFQKIFADFRLLLGERLGPQVLDRISSIARECLNGVLKSYKLKPHAVAETLEEGLPGVAQQTQAPRKIAKLKDRLLIAGQSQQQASIPIPQNQLYSPQLN